MRPGLRLPASSKPPPPDSSQRLGYPLPGWVSTLFQYMYSRPLRLVHWVLQAVVQVWQPMHLFRSITIASCRFDIILPLRIPDKKRLTAKTPRTPSFPLLQHGHSWRLGALAVRDHIHFLKGSKALTTSTDDS